ncbi:MAG TPA: hypothetical protein DCR24_07185 [Bacillus bacterium]|nr:hypothetical protein [Bacillus sp. (in: firmicutes)]
MNLDINELVSRMPDFRSHEEASAWFSSEFGGQFVQKDHDVSEGKNVYYYHVIKNHEAYDRYMAYLMGEGKLDMGSMEPFESYSTIEISEDGDVSISL